MSARSHASVPDDELAGADMEERGYPPAKLLAVDDLPANLMVVSAILGPLGHQIVEARSGPEALELARREEFAVILLDLMMPGMDGLETLKRLRGIPVARHTPVILMSAYDLDLPAMEQAYALGAVDCLSKPVAPSLLRGKVASLASLYRRGLELGRRAAALSAKDRQIAVLAHDLRNPLTTVVAAAALLQRRATEPRDRTLAERVSRSAARMNEMIEALLEFARVNAGAIRIALAPTDMRDVCRDLAEGFELADGERRIEITNVGDTLGQWDRARIFQALSNLVGNATRYGGGKASVHVERRGQEITVAVHNDGPPIPAEVLPRIFEPFERGEAEGAGLGLGLYIVREIARAHRGDVEVVSADGVGTTFTLTLPVRPTGSPPRHGRPEGDLS
jgi:signal transduction histidine kinase